MVCEKNLVLKKICSVKTAQHLTANLFLMNFGGILRSKVCTLRVKARRKTRKQITVRRFRSAPVRLGKREISEPALKPCFLASSALVTLAKSALGYERQVPKSLKNQGLRVFRVLREQIFCRRKGNFCSNMRYCKKISRSECGYLPLKTEFGYLPLAY